MYQRKMNPKTKMMICLYAFLLLNLVLFTLILIKASDKIKTIQVKNEFSEVQKYVPTENPSQEQSSEKVTNDGMKLIAKVEVSRE
ncbi:MAG: hypothetical protein QW210_01240 [Candidatus Woesearchaeota archaeon]